MTNMVSTSQENYYKREVSLMNTAIFPRSSLDQSIHNPNPSISLSVTPVEKSDQEIVDYVVSELKKTGG